jgi:hypothetical protein
LPLKLRPENSPTRSCEGPQRMRCRPYNLVNAREADAPMIERASVIAF